METLKRHLTLKRFSNALSREPGRFATPLTADDEHFVEVFTIISGPEVKLAVLLDIGPYGYVPYLTAAHFARLRPKRWINDEIMNAYATLVNKRNDELSEVNGKYMFDKDIPRTNVFSSFIYSRLLWSGKCNYSAVRTWIRRGKVDVLVYDLLLFPIIIKNAHWVLAGIFVAQHNFFTSTHFERATCTMKLGIFVLGSWQK